MKLGSISYLWYLSSIIGFIRFNTEWMFVGTALGIGICIMVPMIFDNIERAKLQKVNETILKIEKEIRTLQSSK